MKHLDETIGKRMRGEDEFLKNIKTCVRADASFGIKMGQH
jgi:hypothetical protein